jgi:hypothetical protein
MAETSPAAACPPVLAQLRSGTSSSSLESTASALAAVSAFLAQSQGKYSGHLASLSGEQVCCEDFWREFAYYLTFLHSSSRSCGGRLEASTIRGYLGRAFGAAEQLLGGKGGRAEDRAFFVEARGSGWLGALGAEAQRQQRAAGRAAYAHCAQGCRARCQGAPGCCRGWAATASSSAPQAPVGQEPGPHALRQLPLPCAPPQAV